MLTKRDHRDDVRPHADPAAELETFDQRLSRFLPDWSRLPAWFDAELGSGFTPLADVEETDDAYIVEVELPGLSRDDIDVNLAGRVLTISGERKEKERVGILRRRTRVTGRFLYEVVLPAVEPDADVTAGYEDGVLVVRVAKPEAARPRRIPIS